MDKVDNIEEVETTQAPTPEDTPPAKKRGRPAKAKVEAPIGEPDPLTPLERFLDTATLQVRRLDRDRLKRERAAAMVDLMEMYGEVPAGATKKEFSPDIAVRIQDPAHRLMVLSEMANEAWTKSKIMDSLRRVRSDGIQALRFQHNWKPIKIYRLLEGAHDRRVVDIAIAAGDIREVPEMTEEAAKKLTIDAHNKYMRQERNGLFARPERDKLIIQMTEGKGGDKRVWTNAELSRLAKMTTAAVTQIRNGTAPSAKRAARAA